MNRIKIKQNRILMDGNKFDYGNSSYGQFYSYQQDNHCYQMNPFIYTQQPGCWINSYQNHDSYYGHRIVSSNNYAPVLIPSQIQDNNHSFTQPPPIYPDGEWLTHLQYLKYFLSSHSNFKEEQIHLIKNYLMKLISEEILQFPLTLLTCVSAIPPQSFDIHQLHFLQAYISQKYPLDAIYVQELEKVRLIDEEQVQEFIRLINLLPMIEVSHLSGESQKFQQRILQAILVNQAHYLDQPDEQSKIIELCQIYAQKETLKISMGQKVNLNKDFLYIFLKKKNQYNLNYNQFLEAAKYQMQDKDHSNLLFIAFYDKIKFQISTLSKKVRKMIKFIQEEENSMLKSQQMEIFQEKRTIADTIHKIYLKFSEEIMNILKFGHLFWEQKDSLEIPRFIQACYRMFLLPWNQYSSCQLAENDLSSKIEICLDLIKEKKKLQNNSRNGKKLKVIDKELEDWSIM